MAGKAVMLNKTQLKAVDHKEGPAIVLAGPGSGKTTVITHRVKKLVTELGVEPEHILVVTFTKYAANHMEEKFRELMPANSKKSAVNFGTFHAVYYKMLRKANLYQADAIVTDAEKYAFLKEIVLRLGLDVGSVCDFVNEIVSEISRYKSGRLDRSAFFPNCCDKDTFFLVEQEYEKRMDSEKKIDFEDMLTKCHDLLIKRSDILAEWQKNFEYILVDEFQDIGWVEYETIKMLSAPQNNIFVVGDDDQSIYEFRGADPNIMFQFLKDFPGAKEIYLDVNYRSCGRIVEISQNLISHNKHRFKKNVHSVGGMGPVPEILRFESQKQEITYMCQRIRSLLKEGLSKNDIAVLVRNNSQMDAIIEAFSNFDLKAAGKRNKNSIYDSPVAMDVISYISASMSDLSRPLYENDDLLRVINKPQRYISREAVENANGGIGDLYKAYEKSLEVTKNIDSLRFHLNMIGRMDPFAAIVYIKNAVGYGQYIKNCATTSGMDWKALDRQFDVLQDDAYAFVRHKEWLDYIENKKLKEKGQDQESDGINLMTMHAAKGLEFEAVFIVDVNQGIIPNSRAIREEDFASERRLFYVALTRAAKYLSLYAVTKRLGCDVPISMFLDECVKDKF